MDTSVAIDLGRRALILALLLAAPLLCVGLIVGLLVSIVQAVTQIQEMTLTFVPKMVAMVLTAVVFLPYLLEKLTTFAGEMFGPMPVP